MIRLGNFGVLGALGIVNKRKSEISHVNKITPQLLEIETNGDIAILRINSISHWSISQVSDLKVKWDNSDDYIYFSKSSGKGNAVIRVYSDGNNGHRRNKTIVIEFENKEGNIIEEEISIMQFGYYDGMYASTPQQDYVMGLNGGKA